MSYFDNSTNQMIKEFGTYQLEQIMAVAPESYQVKWKKGLHDAKKGSSKIKSSDYELVLNPILENDENDSGEGENLSFCMSY